MNALPALPPQLVAVLLLTGSNIIMNIAWYGHLRFASAPLALVVVAAWGLAFFEYALQVPANRIGHQVFTAPQLKGIQETLSITTFFLVSTLWLGEGISLRQLAGFALMVVAAVLIVGKGS
ncbi:MAG: DMT family protein [Thermaurantiacus tibetensis]|uniref:DMT family protein n=1 Tax=Thermaurantiacus tibetensis TaxID=2759035 RepID=UPI002E2D3658|nr:DMT family protein [Thermaurantiacus tibetensis]